MTERQVITQLKRLRTPYNAEEMDYAIECVMKRKDVDAMEKANSELFERVRELERERSDIRDGLAEQRKY